MTVPFALQSNDPVLLARATEVAEAFARPYARAGMAGIVFLGSLARGYFDAYADIDISFFTSPGAEIPPPESYIQTQGFEIHSSLTSYREEAEAPWDMAKRWAFSSRRVFYDPEGLIEKLLQEKIPLHPAERRWLMIEGITQSDWYIHTLPEVWIARGSLFSAQAMFGEGVSLFIQALFGLNNQLVPDVKWRYYAAEQLPLLPPDFHDGMREVLRVNEMTAADIERRQRAFRGLWEWATPLVEAEVGMSAEEFGKLV